MKRIILASASPRRESLLRQIGLDFEIMPSGIDEDLAGGDDSPAAAAEKIAEAKAREAASRYCDGMVIGADTIVVLNGRIFGKPRNREDALRMLRELSGKEHDVITGIALIDAGTGRCAVAHETTRVFFSEMTNKEICEYIETGEPMDKAGAYAIQGIGALFVEKIEGCFFNVVGLPIMRLKKMMGEMNIDILGG